MSPSWLYLCLLCSLRLQLKYTEHNILTNRHLCCYIVHWNDLKNQNVNYSRLLVSLDYNKEWKFFFKSSGIGMKGRGCHDFVCFANSDARSKLSDTSNWMCNWIFLWNFNVCDGLPVTGRRLALSAFPSAVAFWPEVSRQAMVNEPWNVVECGTL